VLEDIGGVEVKGYRAPSFSIGRDNLWAQACLSEAGYRYSSSVYPIRHDHYGMHEAPRFAFYPEGGCGLLELPVTTVRLFNRNLPAGGGGYFPAVALQPVALVPQAREYGGQTAVHFLFSSVGDRPRTAAPAGHQPEDPIPALRQSLDDGTAVTGTVQRFSVGTGRPPFLGNQP
jgi:hypothetical protein